LKILKFQRTWKDKFSYEGHKGATAHKRSTESYRTTPCSIPEPTSYFLPHSPTLHTPHEPTYIRTYLYTNLPIYEPTYLLGKREGRGSVETRAPISSSSSSSSGGLRLHTLTPLRCIESIPSLVSAPLSSPASPSRLTSSSPPLLRFSLTALLNQALCSGVLFCVFCKVLSEGRGKAGGV
jgi:hypothetical protein